MLDIFYRPRPTEHEFARVKITTAFDIERAKQQMMDQLRWPYWLRRILGGPFTLLEMRRRQMPEMAPLLEQAERILHNMHPEDKAFIDMPLFSEPFVRSVFVVSWDDK